MPAENLKSVSITNLDASPIVENTAGQAAAGYLQCSNDHVASTTGVTSPSTYRLVRVPSNAIIKQVLLTNAALSTSTAADIDIAFSDSTTDGTQQALAGGIVQISGPVDNKLFGSAVSLVAAQKNQDQTFANTYTTAMQNLELWNALVSLGATQFTSDPGGFFDFVVKTTTTVTAGGDISLEVRFVIP